MTTITSSQLTDNKQLFDAAEGATAAGRWAWSKHCAELIDNAGVTREKLAETCNCDKSYVGRVVHAYRHAIKEWGGAPTSPDKVREYQTICNKGPSVAKKLISQQQANSPAPATQSTSRVRNQVPWQIHLDKAFRAMKKQRASEGTIASEIIAKSKRHLGWDSVVIHKDGRSI